MSAASGERERLIDEAARIGIAIIKGTANENDILAIFTLAKNQIDSLETENAALRAKFEAAHALIIQWAEKYRAGIRSDHGQCIADLRKALSTQALNHARSERVIKGETK